MAKAISLENLARFKSNYDTYVAGLISSAISGVYKPKGSKTVSQLNSLTGQQVGDVYNVTNSGTLTAGNVSVVAGDNVVWVTEGGTNKWDKLAGTIDLSGYLPLSAGSSKVLTGQLYANAGVRTNGIEFYGGEGGSTRYGDITTSDIEQGTGHRGLMFTSADEVYHFTGNEIGGGLANAIFTLKVTGLTQARELTVPNDSGTIALTKFLSSSNIATYLGYTPYDGETNSRGFITGITSQMVTNALGYTPYNSTNPNGYISGITASMINTALGADALTQNSFASNSDIDGLFS